MRYELTDLEWAAIKPMLPNKPRGVPRVNDRRVLNGIFWPSSTNVAHSLSVKKCLARSLSFSATYPA
jgi:transposase